MDGSVSVFYPQVSKLLYKLLTPYCTVLSIQYSTYQVKSSEYHTSHGTTRIHRFKRPCHQSPSPAGLRE